MCAGRSKKTNLQLSISEIEDLVDLFVTKPVVNDTYHLPEDIEIVQQGRTLMSFSVRNVFLYLFNQSVVASALLFVFVCWCGEMAGKTVKKTETKEHRER